jgi:hypothetical protein
MDSKQTAKILTSAYMLRRFNVEHQSSVGAAKFLVFIGISVWSLGNTIRFILEYLEKSDSDSMRSSDGRNDMWWWPYV